MSDELFVDGSPEQTFVPEWTCCRCDTEFTALTPYGPQPYGYVVNFKSDTGSTEIGNVCRACYLKQKAETEARKRADDMVERAKKIRHERLREEIAIKLFTTGVMRDTANVVRTLSEACERARTIAHQAIQFANVFVDTYMEHEAKNGGQ